MTRSIAFACLGALALAACAKPPAAVGPSYVSPAIYDNRTCDELSEERAGVAQALAKAEREQTSAFVADAVGVFLFLIPVSAFAGDSEDQLATLKGHDIALEQAMLRQRCFGATRAAAGFPPISSSRTASAAAPKRAEPSKTVAAAPAPAAVEGERLARPVAYTPEEIAEYCRQDWEKRTLTDGTVEYNPCPSR
ncbi:MAG: hypothetical protein AAFN79_01455 [Pseudomonadota bacterium]